MAHYPRYDISCAHETSDLNHETQVADYYPMKKGEIDDLLYIAEEAKKKNDGGISLSVPGSILCRFEQAIPGQMCPHNEGDETERRSLKMCGLFLVYIQAVITGRGKVTHAQMVEKLWVLMQE